MNRDTICRDIETLRGKLCIKEFIRSKDMKGRETQISGVLALAMTLNFFAWPKSNTTMEDIWQLDHRKISA